MTDIPCNAPPPNAPEVEALYPEGSAPEVRIPTLSALCSYGNSPLVMQGALRQTLIQHFGEPQNILNSTLRTRLAAEGGWRSDEQTGIYIESIHKWRPELTSTRPGILLKEHAWTWRRMGIGDRLQEDYRTGRVTYQGHWEGSHTFFALGSEGAETQVLAIEIAKVMLWFSSLLAEQLELQRFVPLAIGEVSALKEAAENYVVPVSVAYVVSESWYTQPEAPRTKQIRFTASEVLRAY